METDKLLYTLKEVSHAAQISPSMVRKLARLGQLEVVHIGRSVRVPRHGLLRLCGLVEPAQATRLD